MACHTESTARKSTADECQTWQLIAIALFGAQGLAAAAYPSTAINIPIADVTNQEVHVLQLPHVPACWLTTAGAYAPLPAPDVQQQQQRQLALSSCPNLP